VGLLSFTLSSCSLVSLFWCDLYGKDALSIYRQASLPLSCKRQEQGKWHRIGAYFVDLVAPIGAS
jgi:hypothetical protein